MRWVLLSCISLIITYIVSEIFMGRNLSSAQISSNIIYLVDCAALSLIGNRAFYSFFIRDTKSQLALKVANEQLKSLDKEKSEFFANVSHELKTPVTLIMAPLEESLHNLSNGNHIAVKKSLEGIRHNVYRLSALINDLLDLTRGEVGKVKAEAVEIRGADDYFRMVFNSAITLMEKKGLKYEFRVSGDED